ncbi:MAG: hypothetical protein HC778_00775 [Chamaesiphon sp. CSU_1_12]|nr:hypothetical protein [Chamaesiphon sp. CSU_1_12]
MTIEYHNEHGLMLRIKNERREVYQEAEIDKFTWMNVKLDGQLIGFIDLKRKTLVFDSLATAVNNR